MRYVQDYGMVYCRSSMKDSGSFDCKGIKNVEARELRKYVKRFTKQALRNFCVLLEKRKGAILDYRIVV